MAPWLDPAVMAFLLGVGLGVAKADVRLAPSAGATVAAILLLAIGLKGGKALATAGFDGLGAPLLATVALGLLVPLVAWSLLRASRRFDHEQAAVIAGHYGSTSAVTFAVALAWLDTRGILVEAGMPVLLAVLEVPALVVGVWLAKRGNGMRWAPLLHEVLLGRGIVLIAVGLLVGRFADPAGVAAISPFYEGLFRGLLMLFIFDLGAGVGARLDGLRRAGPALVLFAVVMPLIGAVLGILAGTWSGLGPGGATVLGVLAGSASYIAAPAAFRMALPDVDLGPALGAALGITFPFNVTVGIPLYYILSTALDAGP